MATGEHDDTGGSIIARLVVGVIVAIVALTLVGWVIGTILQTLKFLVLVGGAVAVIYAIGSARSRRE